MPDTFNPVSSDREPRNTVRIAMPFHARIKGVRGVQMPDTFNPVSSGRERRNKVRIAMPFHARVKGIDCAGNEFLVETVLDNLSAEGLYLRMVLDVEVGSQLSIDVGLRLTSHVTENAPRFLVEGTVLRTEEKPGGAHGVAVSFVRVMFP